MQKRQKSKILKENKDSFNNIKVGEASLKKQIRDCKEKAELAFKHLKHHYD